MYVNINYGEIIFHIELYLCGIVCLTVYLLSLSRLNSARTCLILPPHLTHYTSLNLNLPRRDGGLS